MERKRSKGVTGWAVVFIIFGLINSLSIMGLINVHDPKKLNADSYERFLSQFSEEERDKVIQSPAFTDMISKQNKMLESGILDYKTTFPLNLLNTVGGFSMFILGIGLLNLEEWARKGMVKYFSVLAFIWIIVNTNYTMRFSNITAEHIETPLAIIFVIINSVFSVAGVAIMMYFFTRPKVKEQFK